MRVGILTVQVPFVRGGAEAHAINLRNAFKNEGFEVELITVPFSWYPPEHFSDQILACKLLDIEESCGTRIDMVVGLKFPAYLIPHTNKVLWVLHQHRSAYDLWGNAHGDLHQHPRGLEAARLIRSADHALFPTVRKIFANSENVAQRLLAFSGVASEPLYHPPPHAGRYKWLDEAPYFLMPGRINALKRQELVIEALKRTKRGVKIVIMGKAEDEDYLRELKLKGGQFSADRLEWLGEVSEDAKFKLYGECLGIIVPPLDEDYGYVTLEAMLSSKPVITCKDSGGPLEFVAHNETGIICPPEPEALANAMDLLWLDRARARQFGRAGRARYDTMDLSWQSVVRRLIS